MTSLRKKWGLIIRSLVVVAVLLAVRITIEFTGLDFIVLNQVVTSVIAGVIFTIAIIFAGTLTDYKESEKIPGDLASTIKTLYNDTCIFSVPDTTVLPAMQQHIKQLTETVLTNFRENRWTLDEITAHLDTLNHDIARLYQNNLAPQYIVKLRNEVTNIEKISNRISTIADTSFIPAAYAITELAAAAAIIIMLFAQFENIFESVLLFVILSSLLVSLILFIKDMDNPFELHEDAFVDVDFTHIWRLEEYMKPEYIR